MSDFETAALALQNVASAAISDYSSYKYSKRLMDYQLEKNKEQFDYQAQLQEQYQRMLWQNQGAAQVGSYKQAGLNPAGINSSVVGASLPNLSPSSGGQFQTHSRAAAAMDALRTGKELSLMDAQKKLLESEASKNTAEARKSTSESNLTEKEVMFFEDKLLAGLGLSWSQTGYNDALTERVAYEIDNIVQLTDKYAQDVAESESRIAVNDQSIELMRQQIIESDARVKIMPKQLQIEFMKACAAQVSANAAMKQAEAAEVSAGAAVTSANAAVTSANAAQTAARGSYALNMAKADVERANAQMVEVETKLRKRYGDAQIVTGMIFNGIQAAGSVMSGVGLVGMARSSAKRLRYDMDRNTSAPTGSQLPASTTSYSPLPAKPGYKVIKRGDAYEYMRE